MKAKREYLQSAMFGFNDALVSTTGVIVGVSTGTSDKDVVILAGIVTILVEALSMGAGQYLSSKSAHQLAGNKSFRTSAIGGVIMFVSYFLAGLVPLLAVILFPLGYSRQVAIGAALIGLFILGYYKGKIVNVSPGRSAIEVVVIGGIATLIGLVAGSIFAV
ncbi:VIT1/CCC1 transporter family protein [Candidatus Saccharibacteria bacterium]|nr:VIT1/CCC1 transporter family protein [Candidatus Saccharibacteria bacterium]